MCDQVVLGARAWVWYGLVVDEWLEGFGRGCHRRLNSAVSYADRGRREFLMRDDNQECVRALPCCDVSPPLLTELRRFLAAECASPSHVDGNNASTTTWLPCSFKGSC